MEAWELRTWARRAGGVGTLDRGPGFLEAAGTVREKEFAL